MASDDMRKRLAALNRGRLQRPGALGHSPTSVGGAAHVPKSGQSLAAPSRERVAAPGSRHQAVCLEEIASGEVVENRRGKFFRIVRPLEELTHDSQDIERAHTAVFDHGEVGIERGELRPELARALEIGSQRLLFMDIETTGLGGSPLFLVGLMHFDGETFVIEQLLARDYSEEAAVLRHYHDLLQRYPVLVTFNGKSFDVPQISDRSFVTGVRFAPLALTHVDLLHESRRRWKERFPNFKLQTLETFICRRLRSGDIPGDLIPQAYHDFVRSGNARQMKDILHHNALDLLTMAQVLLTLLQGNRV